MSGGVPQTEVKWFSSQAFWTVIFFTLNYLVSFLSFERLRKKRVSFKYFLSIKSEQLESIKREIALLESEVQELKMLELKEKEFIRSYLYEKMRHELDEELLKARAALQEERYGIFEMRELVKDLVRENRDIYATPAALLARKLGV